MSSGSNTAPRRPPKWPQTGLYGPGHGCAVSVCSNVCYHSHHSSQGTSLTVHPAASVPSMVPASTRRVIINRDDVSQNVGGFGETPRDSMLQVASATISSSTARTRSSKPKSNPPPPPPRARQELAATIITRMHVLMISVKIRRQPDFGPLGPHKKKQFGPPGPTKTTVTRGTNNTTQSIRTHARSCFFWGGGFQPSVPFISSLGHIFAKANRRATPEAVPPASHRSLG